MCDAGVAVTRRKRVIDIAALDSTKAYQEFIEIQEIEDVDAIRGRFANGSLIQDHSFTERTMKLPRSCLQGES